MADPKNYIPWQEVDEWQEILHYFHAVKKTHTATLDPVRRRADEIRQLFDALSRPMDELCAATCINCRDICCKKATIWYDFKDLLYLYFAFDRLPRSQMSKRTNPAGTSQCSYFSASGCLLSRLERPFVCTWYLCPDQKQMLISGTTVKSREFMKKINRIKVLRTEMESKFCEISAGKLTRT